MPGGASLKPSDFQTGGLIDDVDVAIKECRFVLWDYDGKVAQDVLSLKVHMEDSEGQEYDQHYSAGDPKYFVPSEDGKTAVPVGSKVSLNDNTNAAQFITSVINCGFPQDRIEDDISVFDGMECHVKRQPQPKRSGIIRGADDTRGKTILVVTEIHQLPWEKKKGSKKVQAKAQPKAQAKAPVKVEAKEAEDLDKRLQGIILELLDEAGGLISRAKISPMVFAKLAGDPDRKAATTRAFQEDFLKSGPWGFDGKAIGVDVG